jgi:Fe-S-cluster containining protein
MRRRQIPLRMSAPSYNVAPRGPRTCTECGHCCTYVAVEIDRPSRLKWATQIFWFLSRPGVSVHRDDDDEWLVQFEARCSHLRADLMCDIYPHRPHICREFDEMGCEVNAPGGRMFHTQEEFMAYLAEARPKVYAKMEAGFLPPEMRVRRTASRKRPPKGAPKHRR